MERALTRLTLGRGGPRDLAAVRDGLTQAAALRALLSTDSFPPLPTGLESSKDELLHATP